MISELMLLILVVDSSTVKALLSHLTYKASKIILPRDVLILLKEVRDVS
jgi:hypothetical protein